MDRFISAVYWSDTLIGWRDKPGNARHWLVEAIASVRAALVPHLSAPSVFRRPNAVPPSFPKPAELFALGGEGDDEALLNKLIEWRANRPAAD